MSVGRGEAVLLSEILTEVAAREIVPRFRRLGEGAIRCKSGPLDLVTEADEIAEAAIGERLARAFPGAVLIGEEAAARDPHLIRRLEGAPLAIVIDPIDGTANFAAGVPLFGSMAAIVVDGEVAAAAIHDPLGGDTAIAARGEGAEILFADGATQRLRVASPAPFAAMTGKGGAATFRPRAARTPGATPARRHGELGLPMRRARVPDGGRGTLPLSCLYNHLMPWDHLPGYLLHKEAGGHAARLDGSPYRPTDGEGGLLCAPGSGQLGRAARGVVRVGPAELRLYRNR